MEMGLRELLQRRQRKEKQPGQGPKNLFEENSQEDPRTFKDPVERWRVQEKQKEEKWKRRKKKKVKYRRRDLVEKRRIGRKERQEE